MVDHAGGRNCGGKRSIKLIVLTMLAVAIPLYGVIYSELIPALQLFIYPEVNGMIFLALALPLVFLCYPSKKEGGGRLSWHDILLVIIGFSGPIYVAVNWEQIYTLGTMSASVFQLTLGWLTVAVILEAARRTIGWPMVILALAFLVQTFIGRNLPGILHTAPFGIERVLGYLYLSNQGVFGLPTMIVSSIVLSFITFGSFLSVTGAGEFYMKLAQSLLGSFRGGAAKVAVLGAAFFGTMTGEPLSNVGIVGPMTLPLMQRLGYDRNFSAGTVSVAACGGMIMPPVMGAIAFLMAEMTGLGYANIAMAAIVPSFLYFFAVLMQVDFHAAKKQYRAVPKEEIASIKEVLKQGWYYLLPLLVLIFFLLVLRFNPQASVNRALLVLLVITFLFNRRNITASKLLEALRISGTAILPTAAVSAAAGVILGTVTLTGLGINLSAILVDISGGNLAILALVTGLVVYIMGMGVAPVATYVLMAILVAPAMEQIGVPKVVAHFFILYMSISTFITPPFALASYVAASMNGGSGLKSSFYAMRLGIVCYLVPFITIFHPSLLLVGSPMEIFIAIITAIVGIFALASGFEGFMFRELTLWERAFFIAGGFALFIPGELTDILGIVMVGANILWQFKSVKVNNIQNQIKGQ